MASIKGTVTRVVSPTNFFFMPDDAGHRMQDLEGHRVGIQGELSYECHPGELAKGNQPRFRPWRGAELPKVGDKIELYHVPPGARALDEDDIEPPTADQIKAEAARRLKAKQTRQASEAAVQAEMKRLEDEQQKSGGSSTPVG